MEAHVFGRLLAGGIILLGALVPVGQVQAQAIPFRPAQAPAPTPAYSPYLNLARPGNPTLNYYGLVRPELQARAAFQSLEGQVNQVEQQVLIQTNQAQELPATGHPVRFLDAGRFFPGGVRVGSQRAPQTSTTPAAPPRR
jgi:hypothetical protein